MLGVNLLGKACSPLAAKLSTDNNFTRPLGHHTAPGCRMVRSGNLDLRERLEFETETRTGLRTCSCTYSSRYIC